MRLESDRIVLRALEKKDATTLMIWENNPDNWRVSDTEVPYSLQSIQQYIEQQENFRTSGQVRLMIINKQTNEAIGCIDLFDGHSRHRRAAVGILVADEQNRGKGYAAESLELIEKYASEILDLHQLYAHVEEQNTESIRLFENAGFNHVGTLKDWRRWKKSWHTILIYQKILGLDED
jgi:diamine N-acetyltransferase